MTWHEMWVTSSPDRSRTGRNSHIFWQFHGEKKPDFLLKFAETFMKSHFFSKFSQTKNSPNYIFNEKIWKVFHIYYLSKSKFHWVKIWIETGRNKVVIETEKSMKWLKRLRKNFADLCESSFSLKCHDFTRREFLLSLNHATWLPLISNLNFVFKHQ